MDIKKQAEQYAEKFRLETENKGWFQEKVDDFIAGYEAALRQFAVSGSVCDHKDTYIVSGAFGGKWCEKCKEMVDNQTDD